MAKEAKTIAQLRRALKRLADRGWDPDDDHRDADALLLSFINDKEVRRQFTRIKKWYS